MKLGIVGSGMIVQEFLPSLVKLEGLEIMGMQGTKASIGKVEEICIKYGIETLQMILMNFVNLGLILFILLFQISCILNFVKKRLKKG